MIKETLKKTLDEAEWGWLKPHLERDAVIIVAQGLDLLEVGEAVATDSSERIQEWIQGGQLKKPSAEQIESWDKVPSRRFLSLVIQPYVLIQELLTH